MSGPFPLSIGVWVRCTPCLWLLHLSRARPKGRGGGSGAAVRRKAELRGPAGGLTLWPREPRDRIPCAGLGTGPWLQYSLERQPCTAYRWPCTAYRWPCTACTGRTPRAGLRGHEGREAGGGDRVLAALAPIHRGRQERWATAHVGAVGARLPRSLVLAFRADGPSSRAAGFPGHLAAKSPASRSNNIPRCALPRLRLQVVVQRLRSAGVMVLPHRLHMTVTLRSGSGSSSWLYRWPSMRQSSRFNTMPRA